MDRLIRQTIGDTIAVLSIAVLFCVGLFIPYLSAAPQSFETEYEVRK